MAFCPKCGKQINEGEQCSCQGARAANVDVAALANGVVGSAKDIIRDPEAGVNKFVAGANWLNAAVLTGLYALIEVIFSLWYMIKANMERKANLKEYADDWDMDLDEYLDEMDIDLAAYDFGDMIKNVFMDILHVAAGVAVMAVVVFFVVKFVKKLQLTWKSAFAIATIELLIMIPLSLLNEVLGFLPDFKLLSWIMTAISSVQSWGAILLTFLGLKAICKDIKSTVYVMIPVCALCSIGSSLVYFLINSVF